ncbi:ribonuclease PH [Candidatus Cyanaurora vandensis]|uniref:ribonuclease PH n=1 Tax=Candidatus Cyanaurora vandensis TaxID=2714958 RepID=UPI00257DB7DE|nr:ribonuclease PH [Candidatus Cyanaurora vandensis]
MRVDGRLADQLRPVSFERGYTHFAPGAVLARFGETAVLCTVSIEEEVPAFLRGKGQGWLTAEYAMLPGATPGGRARRERTSVSGRTQEIQRLIGRSLRMALDLSRLGPRTLTVDADVLQADGGTRTCAITGGYLALRDAVDHLLAQGLLTEDPLTTTIAAVSVGIVDGVPLLDLCYQEDSRAEVDMNVVVNGRGELIELQATAEQAPFTLLQLNQLTTLALGGITQLFNHQAPTAQSIGNVLEQRVAPTVWPPVE